MKAERWTPMFGVANAQKIQSHVSILEATFTTIHKWASKESRNLVVTNMGKTIYSFDSDVVREVRCWARGKIEVIHIPLRSRDRLISRKGFEMLHSSSYSQKIENLAWSFYGGYHLLHMLQVWLKEMKKWRTRSQIGVKHPQKQYFKISPSKFEKFMNIFW